MYKMAKIKKSNNIQTIGRRKESIARVWLKKGKGEWLVNDKSLEKMFPNKLHQQLINDPIKILDSADKFDIIARIKGGGISGQAGALRLGIARALNEFDIEKNHLKLKQAGFLTRDSRAVERKKAGLKKARKDTQFSKR
jgi:small subunit ribosomal protein S9